MNRMRVEWGNYMDTVVAILLISVVIISLGGIFAKLLGEKRKERQENLLGKFTNETENTSRAAVQAEELKKPLELKTVPADQYETEASERILFPEYGEVLRARGIKHLAHFTNVENLESIFTFGLYSRKCLESLHIEYKFTDRDRYDGIDAICTSVEFPNYKMFYQKRNQYPLYDWAVLWIDADILMRRRARFFETNAASAYAHPLRGTDGFEQMFCGDSRSPYLPKMFPTDPQAEIQIEDHIPAEYIKYVCFQDSCSLEKYRGVLPRDVHAYVSSVPFGKRDIFYRRASFERKTIPTVSAARFGGARIEARRMDKLEAMQGIILYGKSIGALKPEFQAMSDEELMAWAAERRKMREAGKLSTAENGKTQGK